MTMNLFRAGIFILLPFLMAGTAFASNGLFPRDESPPDARAEDETPPKADVTNKKYFISDEFNFHFRAPKGYTLKSGENFYLLIESVSDELAGAIQVVRLEPGTTLQEFYNSWKAEDATFKNWGYTELPYNFKKKYRSKRVRLEHMSDKMNRFKAESFFLVKGRTGYMLGAFAQGSMTEKTSEFLDMLEENFQFLDDFLKKPREASEKGAPQD
jgi:hypothetical protein